MSTEIVTYVTAVEKYTAPSSTRSTVLSRVCSFRVLLACMLAWIVFLVFPKTIADPDLGWHLRNAAYFVQHLGVIHRDQFSFTTAGKPWIDHEWLSELPFYFAWKLFGVRGVWLVAVLLVETIMLGVFGLAYQQSKSAISALLVSFLAIFLASVSFGPRTLLFGWICLVIELGILVRFRRGRDATWMLPPLFMLWINFHGSWIIGLTLLAVFCVCGAVEGNWGLIEARCWSQAQRKTLALVSAGSVLALFVNPYGWRLVFYPFDMAFQQKLNIENVQEWRTVDFHSPLGKIVFGIMAAGILLQLVREQKWLLHEIMFVLVGLYAGFTYSRFLFLAAILILPLLSRNISAMLPYRERPDQPWLNAAVVAGALLSITIQFPRLSQLQKNGCEEYPCQALSYLRNFHPDGNTFNEFRWGGYLLWNTRQIPVFIDSRVDVFEHHGVFADYLRVIRLQDSLQLLDKYKIKYVVFERNAPLTYLLEHTRQWNIDYQDKTTVVLEKRWSNLR